MAEQVLNVTGLAARVEDKQLLHGVDLTINKGETHVLMGPNGAGKSTLGYVLMGAPKYTVTGGQILFKGEDITHESTDKRAKAGMFLSFQEPLEVPGLTLEGLSAAHCSRRSAMCVTMTSRKSWPAAWTFCRWMLLTQSAA